MQREYRFLISRSGNILLNRYTEKNETVYDFPGGEAESIEKILQKLDQDFQLKIEKYKILEELDVDGKTIEVLKVQKAKNLRKIKIPGNEYFKRVVFEKLDYYDIKSQAVKKYFQDRQEKYGDLAAGFSFFEIIAEILSLFG